MASPGETVQIGGGTSDIYDLISEVKRMVTVLPTALKDAVERA